MIRLAILPVCCFDVTVYLLPVLVYNICQHDQVAAHTNKDDSCYPEECGMNEFCCDGQCCSNFARNWFAWTVFLMLLFTIIATCLCVPRLPWKRNTLEPVHYQFISPGPYETWNTKPHKQQPPVPQYHSLATEEDRWPHQSYIRCERLVQQNPPHFTYPAPSAPPKSP